MNRVLTVLVNNRMGVLNRITGLFLKRGFNIQSITVGQTETDAVSRMTIVIGSNDERVVEQVIKQLHKQIDVLKVLDITEQAIVARELLLIKVNSSVQNRSELMTLVEPFRAAVIDVGRESITISATGKPDKIDALIALLRPYGIRELARTGVTAFPRDTDTVNEVIRLNKGSMLPI